MRVRVNIVTKHKADLKSADAYDVKVSRKFKMEHRADLTAQPIDELKVNRAARAARQVELKGNEATDVEMKKHMKTGRKIHLEAFYRAPLEVLRKFPSFRKAELDSAPTETIPVVSKKLHTKSSVTFKHANPEHTNVQAKIMTQTSNALDYTVPSGLAVACDIPHLTCTAVMDYWFMPEIDDEGVLHIKQVSSAVINGDTLEVR